MRSVPWRPARLASTLLAIVVLGCAPQAPGSSGVTSPASGARDTAQAPAPKRITAALQGDPLTLYENINHAGGGSAPGVDSLEQMVNVGLVAIDGDGTLRPRLAEAVPSTDNGLWRLLPEGRMETTWRLREGVTWHDGTPFTAEDVIFTTMVERDRDLPFRRAQAYDLFERIEASDPRTVTVTWTRPYIWADATFTNPFMPRHLLEKSYAETRASFVESNFWTQDFVGSGPYRVREFSRSSHVVVIANDRYIMGKPKIDEILVKFIPDQNAMVANLLAGDVDILLQGASRGMSIEQAMQVRDQWREGRLETKFSNWFVVYPQFDSPSPAVVANLSFRRALVHAMDRQELVDSLQAGMTAVAHSFLNPQRPEYAEVERSIVRYEYDPRRSAQLIEGLGYTMSPTGYRDAAGQRLSVEARTTSSDLYQRTMFSVADYWQRAGVGVEQVVVPPQRVNDREYRSNFPGFDVTGQPNRMDSLVPYFHSREARSVENNFTGENRARYRSPELDMLLDRYAVTVPLVERNQVLGQVLGHMTDQLNVLGLYYTVVPGLMANRLRNAHIAGEGGTLAWNVHLWELQD